jgi:NDP-hexose-3-ketoreductase
VSELRFGVLGCGDIVWRNTAPAMARAGATVVAFASRDLGKAQRFAGRFGGEPVAGYEGLLAHVDVEAIYLGLPTGLHHAWARRALEAGKHVLAEKPLTVDREEAADLVALAEKHSLQLTDNFGFLHHSQHATVRKLIAEGVVGEPQVVSAAFGIPPRPAGDIRYSKELGGGALLDLGVYTVRAARMLLPDEPVVVGSMLRTDPDLGVDVSGAALLAAGGVPAELTFGFRSSYGSRYSVWGSAGRLTVNRAFTPPPTLRPTIRLERQDSVEELTLAADDQFANLIRAFIRLVRDGADPGRHHDDLLRQAALVDQIRQMAR